VLLVEDNEVNQVVGIAMLRSIGLAADLASGGLQAVEKAARHHFDAIVMDVHMPGMDGLEATRRIRKLPGYEHVPVIALTADASLGEQERCIASGMNDYLPKPVDIGKLTERLSRWLPRAAATP
jgi:CheY-like chemotaxis protein